MSIDVNNCKLVRCDMYFEGEKMSEDYKVEELDEKGNVKNVRYFRKAEGDGCWLGSLLIFLIILFLVISGFFALLEKMGIKEDVILFAKNPVHLYFLYAFLLICVISILIYCHQNLHDVNFMSSLLFSLSILSIFLLVWFSLSITQDYKAIDSNFLNHSKNAIYKMWMAFAHMDEDNSTSLNIIFAILFYLPLIFFAGNLFLILIGKILHFVLHKIGIEATDTDYDLYKTFFLGGSAFLFVLYVLMWIVMFVWFLI